MSYLRGDESYWRVNGKAHWLRCFTNESLTYYLIDRCRGSPVLILFFEEEFVGCLITDFWRANDMIQSGSRQYCLAHLLRKIHDIDVRNETDGWCQFSKKLRRLLGDALRICEAAKTERARMRVQTKANR